MRRYERAVAARSHKDEKELDIERESPYEVPSMRDANQTSDYDTKDIDKEVDKYCDQQMVANNGCERQNIYDRARNANRRQAVINFRRLKDADRESERPIRQLEDRLEEADYAFQIDETKRQERLHRERFAGISTPIEGGDSGVDSDTEIDRQLKIHEAQVGYDDEEILEEIEEILPPVEHLLIEGKEQTLEDLEEYLGKDPQRSKGNWRIQNKTLFLTYKYHIDKEYMKDFFHEHAPWDECYVAHETSDKTNKYDHTHVYVRFSAQFNSRDCRVFDIEFDTESKLKIVDVHPNIKIVGPKKVDDIRVKYYISKQDNDGDLQDLRSICDQWNREQRKNGKGGRSKGGLDELPIEDILACKTVKEAWKLYAHEYGHVMAITSIWETRELSERKKIVPQEELFYSWTAKMWNDCLAENWNHRRLKWTVGEKGLDLKTKFCKSFISQYGGMYLKTVSGASNIATLIHEQMKLGHSTKYIFIDIPRAGRGHKMWDTIECLLDGELTVTKYKGVPVHLGESRIMVFSNWSPPYHPGEAVDVSKLSGGEKKEYELSKRWNAEGSTGINDTISPDRWDISDIVSIIGDDGEPDEILVARPNPAFNPNWVKPKRKLFFKLPGGE